MKFSCKPIWGIVLFFLSVVAFQAKAQQSFGGSPQKFFTHQSNWFAQLCIGDAGS